MTIRKNLGGAIALLAAVALPVSALAGPLNPVVSSVSTITSSVSETFIKSLGVGAGISKTITSNISETITESLTQTTLLSFATMSFAVSVNQSDLNYTSPNYNDGVTGSIAQTVTSSQSAGITQIQTTGGNANVTVASNGIYSGSALGSVVGTLGQTVGIPGAVAAMTLAPGFALQNSNAVATLLMATQFANTAAGVGSGLLAIEQNGVNEYSPHHNEGVTEAVLQNVSVSNGAGIQQVQTQGGNANVQAAHNVILYQTSFSGSTFQ